MHSIHIILCLIILIALCNNCLAEESNQIPFLKQLSEEAISGILKAVTEQKRVEEALKNSEMRYETLSEISPVGIFRTNYAGKTTYVNPQWCKISGLSESDALNDGWMKNRCIIAINHLLPSGSLLCM